MADKPSQFAFSSDAETFETVAILGMYDKFSRLTSLGLVFTHQRWQTLNASIFAPNSTDKRGYMTTSI